MDLIEIKNLADLARVDMSQEEMKEIAKDFDSILAYVDQVKEVAKLLPEDEKQKENQYSQLKNVMREDEATNKSGIYADKITEEMPDTQDKFLKVKQIL